MKRILYNLIHDERGFWNMLLPIVGAVGSIFGGASQARGAANQAQNQTALQQYQAELAAKMAQQQGATQRASDIRTAPQDRLRQQLTANMIQGWKPVQVSHPRANIPQVSGGAPAFDQTTQAHAQLMSRDALMRQMQGQGAPDISPVMGMPNAPQMSQSGWLDKLLGIGGMAGGLISGVGGAMQQGRPQSPTPPMIDQQTGSGLPGGTLPGTSVPNPFETNPQAWLDLITRRR